jgi:hypothetical protein
VLVCVARGGEAWVRQDRGGGGRGAGEAAALRARVCACPSALDTQTHTHARTHLPTHARRIASRRSRLPRRPRSARRARRRSTLSISRTTDWTGRGRACTTAASGCSWLAVAGHVRRAPQSGRAWARGRRAWGHMVGQGCERRPFEKKSPRTPSEASRRLRHCPIYNPECKSCGALALTTTMGARPQLAGRAAHAGPRQRRALRPRGHGQRVQTSHLVTAVLAARTRRPWVLRRVFRLARQPFPDETRSSHIFTSIY